MEKVVVTGSETFGRYIENPSKRLALSADGKTFAGYLVDSMIFPSTVQVSEGVKNPGEIIVDRAIKIGASAIVSFGIDSGVKGFYLERFGTNWVHNDKYCLPSENDKPLDRARPSKEVLPISLSKWDTTKMQKLFDSANIPFDPTDSNPPSYYSCNGWIYRTLVELQKRKLDIPYLFVHLPCTEGSIEFVTDFDRENKILISNEDLPLALNNILESLIR